MKVLKFRITHFRSIEDTGWCSFSPDGTTVLVGQNESGKTSILSALATTFGGETPTDIEYDDCRISAPPPIIYCQVEVTFKELESHLTEYNVKQVASFERYLRRRDGRLDIAFKWKLNKDAPQSFSCESYIDDTELEKLLFDAIPPELRPKPQLQPHTASDHEQLEELDGDTKAEEEKEEVATDVVPATATAVLTCEALADAVYDAAPTTILFEQNQGLLPDRVKIAKIDGGWQLTGPGSKAAMNFLEIANVNLQQLVEGDQRARQNILNRANRAVTENFATFWSQTIGRSERLSLECEFVYLGPEAKDDAGQPHLVFWISNGLNKLYPRQRSQGVRWFVSFYLQLKASESSANGRMFLLDEPGANLHENAQKDVLKLINQLSHKTPIIYSTHSPHMTEYDKFYRVRAVQRGDGDETPTYIIDAHKLGAASRDTLSPILMAMGANLYNQQVIQRWNNVILEEISGFYYLTAFWKLVAEKQEAFFIAATGASNVETLANMFLGWGLEFIAAVDDDQAGRAVYNSLKRSMFGDDEMLAKKNMLKIPARGIEDIFDKVDFRKFVLKQQDNYSVENSQHVKEKGYPKPVLAYQFSIAVSKGEIQLSHMSDITQKKIREVVDEIRSRLAAKRQS